VSPPPAAVEADEPIRETAHSVASTAPVEVPPPLPVTEPAAPSPSRRRGEPVSSEPVLERVVVGAQATEQSTTASEAKPRRGWWQRKVLGD
jgi:hypothetical protein